MKTLVGVCAIAALCAGTAATQGAGGSSADREMKGAGNSPFIGTWQIDKSKTKLGARTVKFENDGDTIRYTNGMGGQYTFKADGNEYPTDAPGETVTWTRTGDRSYEVVSKENGNIKSTSQREISPDGKTITVTTTGEADGKPYTNKMTFQRESSASGSDPLIGVWKQNRQNDIENFPATLTYAPAENGFVATYEGPNMPRDSYTLVFDGQDRPPAEEYRTGMTVAGTRIDDRTIQEHWKQAGKPFSSSTIKISPDGRTLTETQTPANPGAEQSVFVYTRKM